MASNYTTDELAKIGAEFLKIRAAEWTPTAKITMQTLIVESRTHEATGFRIVDDKTIEQIAISANQSTRTTGDALDTLAASGIIHKQTHTMAVDRNGNPLPEKAKVDFTRGDKWRKSTVIAFKELPATLEPLSDSNYKQGRKSASKAKQTRHAKMLNVLQMFLHEATCPECQAKGKLHGEIRATCEDCGTVLTEAQLEILLEEFRPTKSSKNGTCPTKNPEILETVNFTLSTNGPESGHFDDSDVDYSDSANFADVFNNGEICESLPIRMKEEVVEGAYAESEPTSHGSAEPAAIPLPNFFFHAVESNDLGTSAEQESEVLDGADSLEFFEACFDARLRIANGDKHVSNLRDEMGDVIPESSFVSLAVAQGHLKNRYSTVAAYAPEADQSFIFLDGDLGFASALQEFPILAELVYVESEQDSGKFVLPTVGPIAESAGKIVGNGREFEVKKHGNVSGRLNDNREYKTHIGRISKPINQAQLIEIIRALTGVADYTTTQQAKAPKVSPPGTAQPSKYSDHVSVKDACEYYAGLPHVREVADAWIAKRNPEGRDMISLREDDHTPSTSVTEFANGRVCLNDHGDGTFVDSLDIYLQERGLIKREFIKSTIIPAYKAYLSNPQNQAPAPAKKAQTPAPAVAVAAPVSKKWKADDGGDWENSWLTPDGKRKPRKN